MRPTQLAVCFALALALAVPLGAIQSPATVKSAAQVAGVTPVGTGFVPSRDGYLFPNRKPGDSVIIRASREAGLTGKCGGIAFGALDHFYGGTDPEETRTAGLERFLSARSVDSILANGVRFVEWTLRPDLGAAGTLAQSREGELPRLGRALADGPQPLGLIGGRTLAELNRNHQVVAYAIERPSERLAVVRLYDPNLPGADDVSLVVDLVDERAPIVEYRGQSPIKLWRGLFLERYSSKLER